MGASAGRRGLRSALSDLRNLRLVDREVLAAELEATSVARLREARLYAVWEEYQLARLFRYLDVDCVFDVGANRGQYARTLRGPVGYRGLIVSFEPNPDEAARAREAARDDPLWHVEEVALDEADGRRELNVMAKHQFSSLKDPRHDETDLFVDMNHVVSTVDVRTETLDTAFDRWRKTHGFERPFLKMDTQGHDLTVVRSGPRAVQQLVGLQSELAIRRLYAGAPDFREAVTAYEELGFEMNAIVPNNAGHFPRLVESDCIMIRSSAIRQEA